MYTVTFYSFKGGVGRTMALVNVGMELARSGQRVLMVDFDLEAPGLDTFKLSKPSAAVPGIVDYVTKYLETGNVPKIEEYLYQSPIKESSGQLWIMPSGKQDQFYQARFNSIDWKELYEKRDGYLFIENLKAQWMQYVNPHYVLIDSRTGHTDTGGICTRQLPDAVANFFFPNEQNLRGLQQVVDHVRKDAAIRKKKTHLHFVMSNVPDLDDEDRILEGTVRRVKETLVHGELDATIHHYSSLALLKQSIFVSERPRSRLAQEYRSLVGAIRRQNIEDRTGALELLADLRRKSPHEEKDIHPTEIEDKVNLIRKTHAADPEVLKSLARLRRNQRRLDEAIVLLDQASELGSPDSSLLLARAEMRAVKDETELALVDLADFFNMAGASYTEVSRAARLLIELAPTLVERLPSSPAVKGLNINGQIALSWDLSTEPVPLSVPEAILRPLLQWPTASEFELYEIRHRLALSLIGLGRFREALKLMSSERPSPASLPIHDAFNYAVAEWGEDGTPPKDLFERVLELAPNSELQSSANFSQCRAIASWALGDISQAMSWVNESRQQMKRLPKREFSAWRYFDVPPSEFLRDLDELERMVLGEDIRPPFFNASTRNMGKR
jgi:MinD-like ATPase involved in chromosome partitioning or flagellar assembly